MPVSEDVLPYVLIICSAAPYALQLALGGASWLPLFILFAFPALSLLVAVGTLSSAGPTRTFARLCPVAAGIGWALAWLVGEKLFVEGLVAAQSFAYMVFSLRPRLDWALDCGHSYNTHLCVPFTDENVTHSEYKRYPDNFWPAQQFNRYLIRGNDPRYENLTKQWEPNEWYLGRSDIPFYISWPSFPLLMGHAITWTLVGFILIRFEEKLWWILSFICLAIPAGIFFFVDIGMTFFAFDFSAGISMEIPTSTIERDPIDYWADLKGIFRTSLVAVDYSMAFTGIVLFAMSRIRPGQEPIRAAYLVAAMIFPPLCLTGLQAGCQGHLAGIQPGYNFYPTTGETVAFDMMAACMATSSGAPLWAFLFYLGNFLYASLGPMLVFCSFLANVIMDERPMESKRAYALVIVCFAVPSLILYMPMGTKIVTFFRYVSQSSIVHIVAFFIIYFVYGWQSLERDLLASSGDSPSLLKFLLSPVGPICTALLFTFVPMMLCTQFTAVFDLLMGGFDVLKHIDNGVGPLIPGPKFLQRAIGSLVMITPSIICVGWASFSLFRTHRSGLPLSSLIRPTNEFLSHNVVAQGAPSKPHSLAYGFFNNFLNIGFRTALLLLFIIEIVLFIVVFVLFVSNAFLVYLFSTPSNETANLYRSCMLLIFATVHAISLLEIRWTLQLWDDPSRLSWYIGMATMEMAMLNGYMWMYANDHEFIDWMPIFFIVVHTLLRSTCIVTAIAVRAHIVDNERPTRTRDITEVYEPDVRSGDNEDDDTPIIFDLAR